MRATQLVRRAKDAMTDLSAEPLHAKRCCFVHLYTSSSNNLCTANVTGPSYKERPHLKAVLCTTAACFERVRDGERSVGRVPVAEMQARLKEKEAEEASTQLQQRPAQLFGRPGHSGLVQLRKGG